MAALEQTRKANGMTNDAHARLMLTRRIKHRPFQHPALSRSGPTFVIIMEHSTPKLPRPIRLANVRHMRGLPMTQGPKLNSHSKQNCILACIASEKAGADEPFYASYPKTTGTTHTIGAQIIAQNKTGPAKVAA